MKGLSLIIMLVKGTPKFLNVKKKEVAGLTKQLGYGDSFFSVFSVWPPSVNNSVYFFTKKVNMLLKK